MSLGLFGYGSLVLRESASMTLGRPAGELRPVRLHDWRQALLPASRQPDLREDLRVRRGMAARSGSSGSTSSEGEDEAGPVNGVVIELTEAELDRLDIREIRYDRVEVTRLGRGRGSSGADRHLHGEAVPLRAGATRRTR